MRPLFALLITVSLLGGVFVYVRFADSVRRTAVDVEIDYAEGVYAIEIESTFDFVPDVFLGTESLKVLFKGKTIHSTDQRVPYDQITTIQPVEGVESGENEFFVTATMDETHQGLAALKVTVKRNDIPVVEKLLTSEPGLMTVSGPVVFSIAAADSEPSHNH